MADDRLARESRPPSRDHGGSVYRAGGDDQATGSLRRLSRAAVACLLLILAIAGALRVVGIAHGLPWVVGPDEGFEVNRALKLGLGEVDLGRVGKGGFFYLLFVEYGFFFLFLRLTGQLTEVSQFAEHFATDITPFWLIGRATHALTSVLTVFATFLLGLRCYGSQAAVLGAAMVAVSPLFVSLSPVIGVDTPMTLLVVILLWLLMGWPAAPGHRRSVWIGVVLGLAVMTKLPAAVAVAPLGVALYLRWRARPASAGGGWLRDLAIVGLVSGVLFLSGNPGFLLKFEEVTMPVLGNTLLEAGPRHPDDVYGTGDRAENLFAYYLEVLGGDFGVAASMLVVAGLIVALARRTRGDRLLLSFVFPYFLVIATVQSKHLYYPRYVLPLIPLLALLAARFIWSAASHLPMSLRWQRALAGLMAVVALVAPARDAAGAASARLRGDSRVAARQWIEANVPAGAAIFLVGNPIVDTAPNLSLPLRNTSKNMERLAQELSREEPSKARFLRIRQEVGVGTPYDLRTVRHFEVVPALDDLRREGVEFAVLAGSLFDPARLERDRKHADAVLESRLRLLRELRGGERARCILRLDAEAEGLSGPWVEVYRLTSEEQAAGPPAEVVAASTDGA